MTWQKQEKESTEFRHLFENLTYMRLIFYIGILYNDIIFLQKIRILFIVWIFFTYGNSTSVN